MLLSIDLFLCKKNKKKNILNKKYFSICRNYIKGGFPSGLLTARPEFLPAAGNEELAQNQAELGKESWSGGEKARWVMPL